MDGGLDRAGVCGYEAFYRGRSAVMGVMDRKGMIAAGMFVKYSVLRQQRRAEKWL